MLRPLTDATLPIGVFDSGVGGLTVAKAIIEQLPQEAIIYFGDTAHFPYGNQSVAAIQNHVLKIVDFLLAKHCKLILIACNSASAAAYKLCKEYVGTRAIVVNVIDPFVEVLPKLFRDKKLGLIGTRQTVESQVYQSKICQMAGDIELHALATPLLAPAIEEGYIDHKIIDALLEEYLSRPELLDIEVLILACTHYPLLKEKIFAFYQGRVAVVDPAPVVASAVRMLLQESNLLSSGAPNYKHFYVSSMSEIFAARSKIFFGENISLELAL